MIRFTLLISVILFSVIGWSQPQKARYDLGVAVHPGFLMAHQQSMLAMQAHTVGVELQFSKRLFPQKSWSSAYRHPRIGVNALYMNLGNPDVNGQVFALMPNFQLSLAGSEKSHLAFRMGTGLGWVTRVFDLSNNRKNLAMSSNLNGGMQLGLYYLRTFKRSELKAGLIVTHFSNASARVPNLGINMPSLFLGYSGLLAYETQTALEEEKHIARKDWHIYATYASKQLNMSQPRSFNIFTLGGKRLISTGKEKRFYRLGGDLFFDSQHLYNLYPDRPDYRGRIDEITEVALTAGYQMGISRVDFFADLGLYAYRPSDFKPLLFQRLGFNCHLGPKLYAHLALKTHYATADIFEWGVGYKLNRK